MEIDQTTKERLRHSRFLRSLIAGAISVICQTAIFEVLGIYLALVSPSTAVVIGGEAGVLMNFFLNNRFAFGDRMHGSLSHRLLRFHIVVLGSIVMQWLFVYIAENSNAGLLLIHAAYAAGVAIGFVWNYNWYRLWVWKQHHAGQSPAPQEKIS